MPDDTGPAPVRLGVIGFGRLAQNYYVPALRRMRDVAHVVAVGDPNEACCAAARKLLPGAAVYDAPSTVYEHALLDAVLVASPPAAHLAALRDVAAKPKLRVFMEKPLLPPGESAALVPDAVRPRVMVNFNRRFWPRYQAIATAAQSGRLGTLRAVEVGLQVNVSKWLAVTQHRVEAGHGGALYDLGSQMIDLAGAIVGRRPDRVRTAAQTKRWEHDHLTLTLGFPGTDVEATCRVAYDDSTWERVAVTGEAGRVFVDDPNRALHFGHASASTRIADLFTFAGHAARRHTSMSRLTIELALRSFVDGVRSGKPFASGFEDGAFNAAALRAAARSIATGQVEPIEDEG